jgi:hypothetical protein
MGSHIYIRPSGEHRFTLDDLNKPSLARLSTDGLQSVRCCRDRIELALEDDYLSRDSSPSRRAAYIRRTIEKARRWTGL